MKFTLTMTVSCSFFEVGSALEMGELNLNPPDIGDDASCDGGFPCTGETTGKLKPVKSVTGRVNSVGRSGAVT